MKNKYLIVFVCYFSFLITVALVIFFEFIEENPIKVESNLQGKIIAFIPQGWNFFTRSPRQAQIILYKKDNKGNFKEIPQRFTAWSNYMGLKRIPTEIMNELQMINIKIPKSAYSNTYSNYQYKIPVEIPEKILKVKNTISSPLLCGEYVVIYQRTIPYPWLKNIEEVKMPAKIIRINISCDTRQME